MIRLSVSDLESYRYFKNDEDSTLEDLLSRLRHEDPPNDQMLAGHAFAKLMEHAQDGDIQNTEVDGWEFCFSLEAEMAISPVRELKAEVVYQTPSGPVTLVGMVDGLNGVTVVDQKLTGRWDPEKYMDSLQWRCYLVMFAAQKFRYDIFVGKYSNVRDPRDAQPIQPGGTVTITEYHPMYFWRYPGVEADVQAAVNELAALISEHLPERVTA